MSTMHATAADAAAMSAVESLGFILAAVAFVAFVVRDVAHGGRMTIAPLARLALRLTAGE